MSKNKIFQNAVVLVSLLFSLNSCSDVLDQVPSDMVSIDRILKKNNVRNFRTNSYNFLNSTFTNNYSNQLSDVYTDDAFRAGTGVCFDWHAGQLSPERNMFASTMWDQYWQGIRRTNL